MKASDGTAAQATLRCGGQGQDGQAQEALLPEPPALQALPGGDEAPAQGRARRARQGRTVDRQGGPRAAQGGAQGKALVKAAAAAAFALAVLALVGCDETTSSAGLACSAPPGDHRVGEALVHVPPAGTARGDRF